MHFNSLTFLWKKKYYIKPILKSKNFFIWIIITFLFLPIPLRIIKLYLYLIFIILKALKQFFELIHSPMFLKIKEVLIFFWKINQFHSNFLLSNIKIVTVIFLNQILRPLIINYTLRGKIVLKRRLFIKLLEFSFFSNTII